MTHELQKKQYLFSDFVIKSTIIQDNHFQKVFSSVSSDNFLKMNLFCNVSKFYMYLQIWQFSSTSNSVRGILLFLKISHYFWNVCDVNSSKTKGSKMLLLYRQSHFF